MAREATPVRMVMRSDGLELVAITQDVGQAHEELDAKYEGTELTVAFNPEYLLDGVEVTPGSVRASNPTRQAAVSIGEPSSPEAGVATMSPFCLA